MSHHQARDYAQKHNLELLLLHTHTHTPKIHAHTHTIMHAHILYSQKLLRPITSAVFAIF